MRVRWKYRNHCLAIGTIFCLLAIVCNALGEWSLGEFCVVLGMGFPFVAMMRERLLLEIALSRALDEAVVAALRMNIQTVTASTKNPLEVAIREITE